jgi:hypothetical protein
MINFIFIIFHNFFLNPAIVTPKEVKAIIANNWIISLWVSILGGDCPILVIVHTSKAFDHIGKYPTDISLGVPISPVVQGTNIQEIKRRRKPIHKIILCLKFMLILLLLNIYSQNVQNQPTLKAVGWIASLGRLLITLFG